MSLGFWRYNRKCNFKCALIFMTSQILKFMEHQKHNNLGSSRSQMFFKIAVLKNIANFTGKRLYWSLFLIKLQVLKLNFTEKRLQHRWFPVKFAKFLRTPPVTASESKYLQNKTFFFFQIKKLMHYKLMAISQKILF